MSHFEYKKGFTTEIRIYVEDGMLVEQNGDNEPETETFTAVMVLENIAVIVCGIDDEIDTPDTFIHGCDHLHNGAPTFYYDGQYGNNYTVGVIEYDTLVNAAFIVDHIGKHFKDMGASIKVKDVTLDYSFTQLSE
jgi:hypothetical protein